MNDLEQAVLFGSFLLAVALVGNAAMVAFGSLHRSSAWAEQDAIIWIKGVIAGLVNRVRRSSVRPADARKCDLDHRVNHQSTLTAFPWRACLSLQEPPNGGKMRVWGLMRFDARLTDYNPERMRFLQIVADLSKESPHGRADGEEVRRRMRLSETELRALVMRFMQTGDLDNTAQAGSIKLSRSAMAARS